MARVVDVRGLVKTYVGGVTALGGVDLQIAAGSVFGLLDPNGAGKTTLMRILPTHIKPTSGEARIFLVGRHQARRCSQESNRLRPARNERMERPQRL